MKFSEFNQDTLLHEEYINLTEMPNLRANLTGISDVVIMVSGKGHTLQHGPRIKVCDGVNWDNSHVSTIPITGKPRIIGNADISQEQFSKIMKWVNLNRPTIMAYWSGNIETEEMYNSIKKIS
jgi:hypothetical protein